MTQQDIIWYWNDQANVFNDPTYTPNTIYKFKYIFILLVTKRYKNCPVPRGTVQVKLCQILDLSSIDCIVGIFLTPFLRSNVDDVIFLCLYRMNKM